MARATFSVTHSFLTQEPVEKPQQSILRRGGRADFVTPSFAFPTPPPSRCPQELSALAERGQITADTFEP